MKNLEDAMQLIRQTISSLGGEFALSNARSYLAAALNELTRVSKKRQRKERTIKAEDATNRRKLSMEEARLRMQKLDQMFAEEQAKLNESD
jgi:hypothetical protein